MTGDAELLSVLDSLLAEGLTVWLDGGWGVDALLGEQTRQHDDVDLVIHRPDVRRAVELLLGQGFGTERDWLPTALALRHADGRAVDLHPVDPTADGGGDQVLPDGQVFHYGPPVTGHVGGRTVVCCSVETQVATHLGYEPDEDDRSDMARLIERFGVAWP